VTLVGLLGALILKPAALVFATLCLTALMRRTGAAARHAVWVSAIGVLLLLPLLTAALPNLRFNRLDNGVRRVTLAAQKIGLTPDAGTVKSSDSPSAIREAPPSEAGTNDAAEHRVAQASFILWALVMLTLVSRRIVAEIRVHRMVGKARHASERLSRLAARVATRRQLELAELRVTDLVASPAVVGIMNPVVLLPRAAESWSDADLEAMLAHELAHVGRRDCLINLCADVAAILYWCNPLVRLAAKRVRTEAERSCDEGVVTGGTDPREYAQLLLHVAHAESATRTFSHAVTAMSRARELESRIIALLDEHVPPPPSRTMTALFVTIGVAITLPAAALTVSAADAPIKRIMAMEPDLLGDSLTSPLSERVPRSIQTAGRDARTAAALGGPDSALAMQLVMALDHVPTHQGDLVRERADWALSQVKNGRLVEPLLASLTDRDWRVQAYAAWTLALARDSRAVPLLIPLVSHPVWRLRAMAAHALSESRDPRAYETMRAALSDPAWQVRTEAVEYFAAIGGDVARNLIRDRLEDRHVAVRSAARSALRVP
jgi:beta-lactamase regulating signal transducer with metallopeptidase domain